MKTLPGWLALAVAWPALASTQKPQEVPQRPKPAYVSSFEGYRRFEAEAPAKDWRRANDEVREAGGHVGILKEAERKRAAGQEPKR